MSNIKSGMQKKMTMLLKKKTTNLTSKSAVGSVWRSNEDLGSSSAHLNNYVGSGVSGESGGAFGSGFGGYLKASEKLRYGSGVASTNDLT